MGFFIVLVLVFGSCQAWYVGFFCQSLRWLIARLVN